MSTTFPIVVLDQHVFDVVVMEVDGSADLDFVLCDPAASEKERVVDYSWLPLANRPRFRHGDALSRRTRSLLAWVERNYLDKCTRELPDTLRAYSKTMYFEYDMFLRSIARDDGRRVEGIAQPVGSGVRITLSIPLLLNETSNLKRSLTNTVKLYAKALQAPLSAPPIFTRVDFSFLIACVERGRELPIDVISERIVMHLEEAASSTVYETFIHSCVTFRGLPQYSCTVQRGASFMDYIPSLESAVLLAVGEPMHFLTLVTALVASLGQAVSVSIASNDMSGDGRDSLVRTASYCVVDEATLMSFTIVMRYHSGRTLPSVEIFANQYAAESKDSTLHMKLQYTEAMQLLERECPSGKMLDVLALSTAIEQGCFESMSMLLSTCL